MTPDGHRQTPRPRPARAQRIAGGAIALAVALLVAGGTAAPAANDENWLTLDEVVMQGLDKVTARVSTFDAPVGKTVKFGSLEITARTCRKRPPEETPESAAFLEIPRRKTGRKPGADLFRLDVRVVAGTERAGESRL